MLLTADNEGKVWFTAAQGDATVRFSVFARDGEPFEPGQVVEYSQEAIDRLLAIVLAPFGAAQVAIAHEY